jgi:hypothetical protein
LTDYLPRRRLRVMRAVLAIGLLAVAATACALMPSGCPTALAQGRLAPDGDGGALLLGEFGETRVRWPDGYVVQQEPVLQLRGPFGGLVASEGDTVYVGGGMTPDDEVFVACGYVSRDPP